MKTLITLAVGIAIGYFAHARAPSLKTLLAPAPAPYVAPAPQPTPGPMRGTSLDIGPHSQKGIR